MHETKIYTVLCLWVGVKEFHYAHVALFISAFALSHLPPLCCHSTFKHWDSLSNPGLHPFCFLDHSWPRVGTHCLWVTFDLLGPGTCSPPPSRQFEWELKRRLERKELESQPLTICKAGGCDSVSSMLQHQQFLLFRTRSYHLHVIQYVNRQQVVPVRPHWNAGNG